MPKCPSAELDFAELVHDKLVAVAFPNGLTTPEILREFGARDVLLLRRGDNAPRRLDTHVEADVQSLSDMARNNCEIAILNGIAGLALFNKRLLGRYRLLLVPTGLRRVAATPGLLRYSGRKQLVPLGVTRLTANGSTQTYLVVENRTVLRNNRRLFGPTGDTPLEILKSLEGLDYAILRWIEDIESGVHQGDIDILVSYASLPALRERLAQRVGTYPIDVYTDGGEGGHTYKNVPYFVPEMASRILGTATVRKSGIRAPSAHWRYLLFCYHLLFHNKSERVPAGQTALNDAIFSSPKYLRELKRLAVGVARPEPRTFDDLERALQAEGVLPGIDLIGFYSAKNPFLKRRYLDTVRYPPGLTVMFLRDFGEGLRPVPEVRRKLEEKFRILAEGPITDGCRRLVMEKARGGNWHDKHRADDVAGPVYWFVCWDEAPAPPSRRTQRKYPRIDNENVRIKDEIRHQAQEQSGEFRRLVHSGDNTAEAMEHIALLGIADHPEIKAVIDRVTGAHAATLGGEIPARTEAAGHR